MPTPYNFHTHTEYGIFMRAYFGVENVPDPYVIINSPDNQGSRGTQLQTNCQKKKEKKKRKVKKKKVKIAITVVSDLITSHL